MKDTDERRARLLPNGCPRWVRVYRNDHCYTVVYTGAYKKDRMRNDYSFGVEVPHTRYDQYSLDATCASKLYHGAVSIDTDVYRGNCGRRWPPAYGRMHAILGRRIMFDELPESLQRAVLYNYCILWRVDARDYEDAWNDLVVV